jgi:ATP-dependent 26S proteasome regulatory subunit
MLTKGHIMTSTSTLTEAQATVRSADEFRRELRILDAAACGVVLVRTSEPFRAAEAVKAFAYSMQGREYAHWSLTYGWEKYSKTDPAKPPATDNIKNPVEAMSMIGGLGGDTPFKNGFYTFMYPQFWLKDNVGQRIPLIYTLKEYARTFAESKRRLILITPVGVALPPEVADDVVVLDFEMPSFAELTTVLDTFIESLGSKQPRMTNSDKARIVASGMGMSQAEFESAVARSVVTHKTKLPNLPVDDIVEIVMAVKTEVVKRSEVLEVMPSQPMSDIGGLDNLKEWVAKRARCFSQEAKDFGIEAPKGCGLFGPPGTGKSLSAKAIASSLELPLIKFDLSSVFQSLVGQSEERVRAALKMLDSMAPCVVLLDEIDKVFQRGSSGDSGVSQRVLGAVLTHMQESDAPIFWVFSANRVDALPPELLRKGRLDEIFAVSVPDATERLAILEIHLRKRGFDAASVPNLDEAVAMSDGYVPAELEQAVKDALIDAFTDQVGVSGSLIANQLSNIKPLSQAFAEDFQNMQQWAENNARPASKSIVDRQAERGFATRERSAPRPLDVG